MGVVGRLDQYASMLATEFDDYSMSENLFTYSNDFSQSVWTKTRTNILANSTTAPDGTNTAFKLYDDTSVSNSHRMTSTAIVPAGLALPTGSIFVKAGEYNRVLMSVIRDNGTAFAGLEVAFNLITGTIITDLGYSGTTGKIEPYSNGWYRISIASTVTATINYAIRINLLNLSSAATYTGDGTSGIYIWGAQLETGSVATDYTPTTTTAKTRVLPATTNTNITGLGTCYSSEFSENIGIVTTNTANVFTAYDQISGEFADTLYGPGNGTYMRQNTDKSVIVYNEIDEISDFRDIVRSGLVLDLDAGMNASYPGSGTTWTDLSGNGNTGTLVNNPTYFAGEGGYFSFGSAGSQRTSFTYQTPQQTASTAFTWSIWTYPVANSDGYVLMGYRGTTPLKFYKLTTQKFEMYPAEIFYLFTLNVWQNICVIYDGTQGGTDNMKMYVNGIQRGLRDGDQPDFLNSAMPFFVGGDPDASEFATARIGQVSVYNRALTAAEVSQNYNALKHRFGL